MARIRYERRYREDVRRLLPGRLCLRWARSLVLLRQFLMDREDQLRGGNRVEQCLAFHRQSFSLRRAIHKLFCPIGEVTKCVHDVVERMTFHQRCLLPFDAQYLFQGRHHLD